MSKKRYVITAVISDKHGHVLSVGQNSFCKTHPLQARHAELVGSPLKQYLHAEVAAIVRCKNLNKAHKIFISRWSSDGKPALAKPCPICMSAIKAAGIEVIEHT